MIAAPEWLPAELGKMSDEDLIADEQVVVTLTAANYIKRSPIAEYKRQGRGGKGRRGCPLAKKTLSSTSSMPARTTSCCSSPTKAASSG